MEQHFYSKISICLLKVENVLLKNSAKFQQSACSQFHLGRNDLTDTPQLTFTG